MMQRGKYWDNDNDGYHQGTSNCSADAISLQYALAVWERRSIVIHLYLRQAIKYMKKIYTTMQKEPQ